jgi:hypothetical protein
MVISRLVRRTWACCCQSRWSRMPLQILRAISPRRIASKLSVRARIVLITLIPVIGFLGNGLTYVSGEREVDAAFGSFTQATTRADASRDFKRAVVTIQAAARSFAEHLRPGYLQILADAQGAAAAEFAIIQRLSDGSRPSNLEAIAQR